MKPVPDKPSTEKEGTALGVSWDRDLAASEKRRVLLVEDDPLTQLLTQKLLEERGHSVQMVTNGLEALEALRTRVFDVVLMDLEMPEMDGFRATREIRAATRDSSPPIVAYTAHVFSDVRGRCRAAGMDGFLSKPVTSGELFQQVERWPRRSDA